MPLKQDALLGSFTGTIEDLLSSSTFSIRSLFASLLTSSRCFGLERVRSLRKGNATAGKVEVKLVEMPSSTTSTIPQNIHTAIASAEQAGPSISLLGSDDKRIADTLQELSLVGETAESTSRILETMTPCVVYGQALHSLERLVNIVDGVAEVGTSMATMRKIRNSIPLASRSMRL
jgi:hypothetical protein